MAQNLADEWKSVERFGGRAKFQRIAQNSILTGSLVTSTGDRPEICPVSEKHPDNCAWELNQLEHLGMQTFFRKKYLKYCVKEFFWTYTLEDFWSLKIATMG